MNTPLILEVSPVRKTADRQLHRTLQWAQIGWLNWKLAREPQRTSKKKAVLGKSKQKNKPVIPTLIGNKDIEKEKNTERVYEGHLEEEYEVKMRIPQKKEQLLDLNLQLFRRKLNIDE